jgi:Tfp pilus assembly protein PilO
MTSNRIWIIGAAVVIVGIAFLGWFLGIAPKLAEGDASGASLEAVETQNTAQEAVLVSLREQFERLDELKLELDDLRSELPDHPEVETFIEYINSAALETGVTVSSITAVEPMVYGIAAEAGAPAAPDDAGTEQPTAAMLYSVGLSTSAQPENLLRQQR